MSWICLHRKIKDSWVWDSPEKFKWWIDVLLTVNHAENKVLIKGQLITCGRGQSVRSLETWAKDWRTTKKTVSTFFKLMQSDGMIRVENLLYTTRITVCKYDSYNVSVNGAIRKTVSKSKQSDKEKLHGQSVDNHSSYEEEVNETETQKGTESKRTLPPNNNEQNNTSKDVFSETEKKEFFDFQEWIGKNTPALLDMKEPFLIEHFTELRKKYTKRQITDMCEKMHNNNGLTKKYKSAYVTLKNWIKQYGT